MIKHHIYELDNLYDALRNPDGRRYVYHIGKISIARTKNTDLDEMAAALAILSEINAIDHQNKRIDEYNTESSFIITHPEDIPPAFLTNPKRPIKAIIYRALVAIKERQSAMTTERSIARDLSISDDYAKHIIMLLANEQLITIDGGGKYGSVALTNRAKRLV